MRSSILIVCAAAVLAAGVLAASAFTYADLAPRDVIATIVADEDAYLAIAAHDPDYDCFVGSDGGRIKVTWKAADDDCGAGVGAGLNSHAIYHFHDVLKLTNKGTKTLENIWLNMTGTEITIVTASSAGAMRTGDSYATTKTITELGPGVSYYIGFKIDTSARDADTEISETLSIEARSSA